MVLTFFMQIAKAKLGLIYNRQSHVARVTLCQCCPSIADKIMSTEVLEASPDSGNKNDPFSSKNASIFMKGTLQNARLGGTSCGLSVVVESELVASMSAETLPAAVVSGGGTGPVRKRYHQSTTSNTKPAGQIKRRRKTYERNGSKPKFLLGGSITDPLNLNSLDDEETSKLANAVTPACSPLPHINKDPDPVIVPQDFKDPLRLNTADDGVENNSSLTKTLQPRKSSGKKKKYGGEGKREGAEYVATADRNESNPCIRPLRLELQSTKLSIKTAKLANKIVSPVLPDTRRKRKASRTEPSTRLAKALLIDDLQPLSRPRAKSGEPDVKRQRKSPEFVGKFRRQHSHEVRPAKHVPKFREEDRKFQYGNYARYYGYRNPDSEDGRIEMFKREWFEGKKCLDIGCNSGHVTLAVAKLFNPSSMVGLDIDGHLIGVARKNVRYCLEDQFREKKGKGKGQFPISMEKSYGPLVVTANLPAETEKGSSALLFPANVLFRCANFVLEKDSLLDTQKEEYDTILCLSVTKWVHLNWGDAGIKRFFKRIFRALNPGGRLLLEPQSWSSYKKKRKITETTYRTYEQIRFKPHHFKDYLLSQDVGFASCEVIGTPLNKSKGFRRPVLMFTKLQAGSSRPVSRRPSPERLSASSSRSSFHKASYRPAPPGLSAAASASRPAEKQHVAATGSTVATPITQPEKGDGLDPVRSNAPASTTAHLVKREDVVTKTASTETTSGDREKQTSRGMKRSREQEGEEVKKMRLTEVESSSALAESTKVDLMKGSDDRVEEGGEGPTKTSDADAATTKKELQEDLKGDDTKLGGVDTMETKIGVKGDDVDDGENEKTLKE